MRQALVPVPVEALERFESIYLEAEKAGDPALVPWEHGAPNPALVAWLDHVAPGLIRCGCRVGVVGCGLGHDARELIRRGYEVTAFDVSAAAVRWAKALDPDNAQCYFRADVLEPPPRWVHRFDLVVESYTIQSLPPEYRPAMVESISRLVGMNGNLLVICRAAEGLDVEQTGPPWPMTESELLELASMSSLQPDGVEHVVDDESPPRRRMRALFHRA